MGYDITWDNTLANIFLILRYSFILTVAKELGYVPSVMLCFLVRKTNLIPQWYLVLHLSASMRGQFYIFTFILGEQLKKQTEIHLIQEILKILKKIIFDAYFKSRYEFEIFQTQW